MKKNYLQSSKSIVRNSLSCISFILLLFATMQMYAENPQCQWAKKIAGSNYDFVHSINTDANGNVYVAGYFESDTLIFFTLLNSYSNSDAYIAKYNSSGVCQWTERIAGTSWDVAFTINTDANSNVYVAGYFYSPTLTFNNGLSLSNSGFHDGFIAKYNSDGVCQWTEKIAGTDYDDVYSINTDANGNLYVAGYFDSPKLTFNNGIMLSSSGFQDGFIAKYNSDGVCQWAEKIAGTGYERTYSISSDAYGNVYLAGYFGSDILTFNNVKSLSKSSYIDSYLAKYNSDGVCQWAEKIAGTVFETIYSIITDAHCNVYIAGYFDSATLTFNNGITLSNSGSGDVFIAKYNSEGVCQWAEKIAGTGFDDSPSISTVPNNNVYIAGYFNSDTLTFNNGITVSNSGYGKDGYIAKYNSGGVCQWAEKIGGTNWDGASSISTDANRNVYVAGYFESPTLSFNNGITLSNSGESDAYIAKYTESPQGIPFLSSSTNNAFNQPLFLSPNPVNDNSLNISFNLLTPEQVTIEITNMLGEVVSVVKANEFFPQGEHSSNADISKFPAGTYFCILRYKDKVYQQQFIRY